MQSRKVKHNYLIKNILLQLELKINYQLHQIKKNNYTIDFIDNQKLKIDKEFEHNYRKSKNRV